MICARCDQPIELGQLYHQVQRHTDAHSEDPKAWPTGSDLFIAVHDYPCPTRIAIVGGEVKVDSQLVAEGTEIWPLMVQVPKLVERTVL